MRPALCDGDGRFGVYRKWFRQFFGEEALREAAEQWAADQDSAY